MKGQERFIEKHANEQVKQGGRDSRKTNMDSLVCTLQPLTHNQTLLDFFFTEIKFSILYTEVKYGQKLQPLFGFKSKILVE